MVVTLLAFCAGAFVGSLDIARYADLPSLGAVSLAAELGLAGALVLQLGVLALVWLGLRAWAKGRPQRPLWQWLTWDRLLRGPWPLLFAAAMLAGLNALTLVVAGHPWTVTWAFTLWGAKAATAFGWDPSTSSFWSGGFPGAALEHSILRDNISIMDWGIIAGALTAAGLAGPLRAKLAGAVALAPRRDPGRPAHGLRCAPRVRLQHRRVLLGHRVLQPAWLALDRLRPARNLDRHQAAPAVRAR